MPRAGPETMMKPASASSCASWPREFQSRSGGVAGADDCDHRPHQAFEDAAHAKQRRCIVDGRKPRRMAGLAGCL
jgi:hypothetical protein